MRMAPPSFIPGEHLKNYVEDRLEKWPFSGPAINNISGNCPQEEIEGDARQTTKGERFDWDVECLHFKPRRKTKRAEICRPAGLAQMGHQWTPRYTP